MSLTTTTELELPPLQDLFAYRGVYVLASLNRDGKLRGMRYAICLIHGPDPLWGVWNINGKFLQFYGSRQQIQEAHPTLRWRRKMGMWRFLGETSQTPDQRRVALRESSAQLATKPKKKSHLRLAASN